MKIARVLIAGALIVYLIYYLWSSVFTGFGSFDSGWSVGQILDVEYVDGMRAIVVAATDSGYLIVDSGDGDIWNCSTDNLADCWPTQVNCFDWVSWDQLAANSEEYLKCLGN